MKLRLGLGLLLAVGLLLGGACACSGRRLPPGTPPPEYEPPLVTPWPADAGSDAAVPATPDARDASDGPGQPAVESELSLDAGPR